MLLHLMVHFRNSSYGVNVNNKRTINRDYETKPHSRNIDRALNERRNILFMKQSDEKAAMIFTTFCIQFRT